ncbi:MAG: 2-C-methyl-D-erythritol 2,4-cyclodiphosphate synthase [Candidatus Competibacteraceae bacterium]|nr:2-C-methyl-D-erythritol 2,4-cyclodiphosphate synthase [Candidatus Competibacteraceae bacterium]
MIRVGLGYDLHRLEAGLPLLIGGVLIPHDKGLAGHSDADVLAHAITDALLGAAALGNIGQHFPDTDPRYKGADSIVLLRAAYDLVREAGFRIVNIDSNIVAQRPKLNPHLDAIRTRLASALDITMHQISVKAKTNELVGPEGREEAISTQAIVLIETA